MWEGVSETEMQPIEHRTQLLGIAQLPVLAAAVPAKRLTSAYHNKIEVDLVGLHHYFIFNGLQPSLANSCTEYSAP